MFASLTLHNHGIEMQQITKTLSHWLKHNLQPNLKLLVAYSGGRDSHVLLDALVQLKKTFAFELEAIHVNHGLQAIAASWPLHCQAVCDAYDVPLSIINLSLSINPGESLEEKARTHRYEAFALHVCANTLLLTAHTQDDQAETFLLQMMRGSGIQGLASIAPSKPFSQGVLARPLLTLSRAYIADYALEAKLQWIEDPSNHNLQLRRNFVRKEIVSSLENIQPNVSHCIARSATHCQQALSLLEDYLAQDVAHCVGDLPFTLKVDGLKAFTVQKQAFILRHWLSKNHCLLPNSRKCQEILKQLLRASIDANPQVSWGKWQLRRFGQLIYLLPIAEEIDASQQWEWDLQNPLRLADESCHTAYKTVLKSERLINPPAADGDPL